MTFAVKVVRINQVESHPNADRLDLVSIAGWQCVAKKGDYKPGDLALYIPIDSILPIEVESKLFGPDSKVKLSKSRVKTIKLRGAVSQGMLAPCSLFDIPEEEGYDATQKLGIVKYEPPEPPQAMNTQKAAASPKKTNPNFHKYGGIDNFKYYPDLFAEGEEVVITEKIHGTNFRCGWVPSVANTLWKKVKRLFGMLPEFEFVYGSNNVQLTDKLFYNGYYDTNVYAEAVVRYNLRELLKPGEVVYGEIYGPDIQKGYHYGLKPGQRKFIVFDLMKNDEYVSTSELQAFCKERGLEMVPVLYSGPFNKEVAKKLTLGDSVLEPTQRVREGVVIKPVVEAKCFMGRKFLKYISDDYLLKDNSDFH